MKTSNGNRDKQMLITYRHDEHKTRGGSHTADYRTFGDIRVNQDVPYGADADASALSRPNGEPQQVMKVPDEETHYRRSLLTGNTAYTPGETELQRLEGKLMDLFTIDDARRMHRAWLESDVAAIFNESWYYPYTSLKYHTLLTAALVDNYRQGHEFDDLHLQVSNEIITHQTILNGGDWALTLTGEPHREAAKVASAPWRNWASVWSRLPQHPDIEWHLDSQLRRIQSWSSALQFIEDYQKWGGNT